MFDKGWKRAAIFLPLIILLLVFSAFPERFRAEATLTPADPSTLGLSDTLGQLGALNSVFGKQAEVEVALRIGTSKYTRETVMQDLDLENRLEDYDIVDLHRWLDREVEVRSLRGGIILIQMDSQDYDLASDIVGAYTKAIRTRLADITERQTEYKREVLERLVSDAGDRLSQAQATFDEFRLRNGYADPFTYVDNLGSKVPALRAQLDTLDRELATARSLYTDSNIIVTELASRRNELAEQIEQTLSTRPTAQGDTVGEAVTVSTRLFELERELNLAKTLYTNYLRYLEGTTVEDLTSTANIRILEEPYVATERQFRWTLVAAAAALFLIWMALEFYRLRPPVGAAVTKDRELSPHRDDGHRNEPLWADGDNEQVEPFETNDGKFGRSHEANI
ncbi:hypothetical protein E3U23_09200 [Erythrobacter litoralis]|uniref:hypothetical protein n=1 Tax=Erythrobacter litoralis TaxID=39960 RepID=UPI002435D765|nr:hypothetical protein [Erythrobacter litoralis]MDG6079368.1 hypothetical protein [Erythrobacter litoralis]